MMPQLELLENHVDFIHQRVNIINPAKMVLVSKKYLFQHYKNNAEAYSEETGRMFHLLR